MSMEKILETHLVQALRNNGLVKNSEIVKVIGDIYVAEDVVTGERRVLTNINESNIVTKRVLRD